MGPGHSRPCNRYRSSRGQRKDGEGGSATVINRYRRAEVCITPTSLTTSEWGENAVHPEERGGAQRREGQTEQNNRNVGNAKAMGKPRRPCRQIFGMTVAKKGGNGSGYRRQANAHRRQLPGPRAATQAFRPGGSGRVGRKAGRRKGKVERGHGRQRKITRGRQAAQSTLEKGDGRVSGGGAGPSSDLNGEGGETELRGAV
jgi:hypothetical protein